MSLSTKTYSPKASEIERSWRVIDATGRPLGRLASEIAQILKGKDKPIYTPHMDTGDFVIVVNASKIVVTGNKARNKLYYTHSTYPGGFKATSFEVMLARHPRRVIEWAVWGMLPKNSLGRTLLRKLKVYAEESHPHGAQIKVMAGTEKVGRPGKPRPAKKVRVATVAEAPPPKRRGEPLEEAAAVPAPEAPEAEPVAEESQPVAAAAVEEPQPVAEAEAPEAAPVAEEPPAAPEPPELAPIAVPPSRSRSRRARAQESTATEAAPVAEEPPTAPEPTELAPIAVPPSRSRPRRARAQESTATEKKRAKKPSKEDAGEQPGEQEV